MSTNDQRDIVANGSHSQNGGSERPEPSRVARNRDGQNGGNNRERDAANNANSNLGRITYL